LTKKISNYSFDCYELNMSPVDRRAYLHDYEEKLHAVVHAKNLEDMTTNETKTLWRKLYGNSQYASPLVDYLGSVIDNLEANLGSIKNQKKSQLRKKTIETNSIKEELNNTTGSLLELSAAYVQLKNELESKGNSTSESQKKFMDKLAYEIGEATTREAILLESIEYLSSKIQQHGVIIPITEMPHHKAGIKSNSLLKNKNLDLPNDE
jgi:hypothetical protein